MNNAGAIVRVSTTKQLEGTSPEKQLEAILTFADKQDYLVGEENIWRLAESGGSRNRTGFRKALDASGNGDISRVYVYSIDRLTRDLLEMLLFLRQLDDLDIECWGAEKGQRLSGNDFMLQVEGAFVAKERQDILRRTQDGLKRAIKAGKYSSGIIAYGYRLNNDTKKLEVEEEEAKVVRKMFKWSVEERLSCVKIAERLNALNIPTRYQKDGRKVHRRGKSKPESTAGIWRAGRVRNMLRNPAYVGKWEWGKRSKKRNSSGRIPGYCPPIITEDIFHKAGDVLRKNNLWAPRNTRRQYLLRGLIKCEVCGLTFCGSYSKVGPSRSREKTYYRCNGKTAWRKLGIEKCESLSLDAEAIETVIWADIKNFCKCPEITLQQLREQRKPFDSMLDDKIKEIDDQLNELKRQEVNLLEIAAASQEVNTETLDTVMAKNTTSQESLLSYRANLESERIKTSNLEDDLLDVAERLTRLDERIDQSSYEEKRRAVEELVKNIQVKPTPVDGKRIPIVTITYRFNEPCPTIPQITPAVVPDYTPERAVTTAI